MKLRTLTRPTLMSLASVALLVVAGCSSSTSKPAAQSTPSQPSSSSSAPSSSSSSSGTSATTVSTAMASVGGTQETVLTAPDGKTLYYFTPDNAAGKATCTASCATAWPPLVVTGSAMPGAGSGVTGTLAAAMGGNGDQVTYNGHPLYEFGGDASAGQANGVGVAGKWFAATPATAAGAGAPAAPAPSSSSSSGGGYGNY